jgi:hypothetical protein
MRRVLLASAIKTDQGISVKVRDRSTLHLRRGQLTAAKQGVVCEIDHHCSYRRLADVGLFD